jgi:hypothetical protein
MRLESVRSLKEELLSTVTRRVLTRSALPREAREVASALPVMAPPPSIALGIEGRDGNYRLAVRIQEVTPGLQRNIDRIFEQARGEASIKIIGRLVKQQPWHRSRNRPLLAGGSVGHPNITAGTLGCFVTASGNDRLVLSNNHVLADENRAAVGDSILQPGSRDGGQFPQDRVATLSNFVPLSDTQKNQVDAAVALLDEGVQDAGNTLTGLGLLQGMRSNPIEGGETVLKIGRTTGLTRGRVSAFDVDDVWVGYDMGVIGFDGQIEIEPEGDSPFSLGGDSGSLIVDEDFRAVALLFAGNDVDVTFANPIEEVVQALGVGLL